MELRNYIDELRLLVNTDSGTSTIAGVTKVAEMMFEKYRDMGWHTEIVDLGSKVGPGVIAANKPESKQFDVLLVGHLDTVFPEGTAAARPFSVDGDVARGPGIADMKAGLLSIVYVLRTLEKSTLDRLAICVVMNPDEEIGSPYSQEWIGDCAIRSKCVLDFEPARPDGSLVKARKGVCGYQIDFTGVPAHAGNDPQKGRSAVMEMAHWIQALAKFNDYPAGTTINVGIVTGGAARNVVPDHACAKVDIRFWKTSELEKIEQALSYMQKRPFTPDIKVSMKRQSFRPAMEVSAKSEELMRLVENAGRAMDLPVIWGAVGGGSDACNTANLGVPSLDGFGPIGGNFHGDDEFLRLDSVMPRIQLVKNVLQRLCLVRHV